MNIEKPFSGMETSGTLNIIKIKNLKATSGLTRFV